MNITLLRAAGILATGAVVALGSAMRGDAHKPITSPFTFNDDVLPIVRERCAACHQPGGVAPMSLLTHADAVPWGESMRAELMAGHMPPWRVDRGADRFRNVRPLTGRELNVLLTWASGGTPEGEGTAGIDAETPQSTWPLGAPDLVLPMPSEVTIPADTQEHVAEFVVRPDLASRRLVRAVDLAPGTPAIVRSATVIVRTAPTEPRLERVIALWVPGDHPVSADRGSGFEVPAGAELVVRIRYRKTWEYENRAMTDRSTLGVYFAADPAEPIRRVALEETVKTGVAVRTATTLSEPVRALALYADRGTAAAAVELAAVRPDGTRETLIAFRPNPDWTRRYWFREPIVLPRGTRLELQARDEEPILPPAALPRGSAADPAVRVVVNVVPES